MRAFTMYVTVMPVASRTYYCSPKSNYTGAAVITLRAIRILVGKQKDAQFCKWKTVSITDLYCC